MCSKVSLLRLYGLAVSSLHRIFFCHVFMRLAVILSVQVLSHFSRLLGHTCSKFSSLAVNAGLSLHVFVSSVPSSLSFFLYFAGAGSGG